MTAKAKKIEVQREAYKKLLKMAKEEALMGFVGGSGRENLLKPLIDRDFYPDNRELRLNHALDNLEEKME